MGIPEWSSTELEVMRVGLAFVAVLVCARMPMLRPEGAPPYPVGIARIVDLGWAGERRWIRVLQYVGYAAALFYVADLLVPWALVALTVVVVVDATYRSSFGAVNHGDHLLTIVLTAQTVATVLWNVAQHYGWELGSVVATSQPATATWWSIQVILAAYFVSGLSKLVNTRGRWVGRSPGLLLAAAARAEVDSLMGAGSWGASGQSRRLTAWLVRRPTITRTMFAAGLLVELLAPVGLVGEVALAVVGLALLALHRANGRLLGLPFPDYQILVFVFLVNVTALVT